ncbi:uncharacterized protein [Macrobrachium rosenbergii]|uniref:uncharacterized protein isoform X1 n=2 Tax=Macrobrachium rosenbergii TaxID=79674 RepID=UPI0034D610F1
MTSADIGIMDFLFEKDDSSPKGLTLGSDGFKNVIFSSSDKFDLDTPDIKEELEWKLENDWDADELLRSVLNGSDVVGGAPPPLNIHGPTLASSPAPLGSSAPMSVPYLGGTSPLSTPTLKSDDDIDDLKDLVGLPFDVVLDSGASDSGMSSDSNFDQQMSPLSGCSVASPGSFVDMGLGIGGFSSSESGADTISEVSSISDLGSSSPRSASTLLAPPGSPEAVLGADDFFTQTDSGFSSPAPQIVPELVATNSVTSCPVSTYSSVGGSRTPTRVSSRPSSISTKVSPVVSTINNIVGSSPPILKTVTVAAPSSTTNSVSTLGGQTIVVTQASKGGPTGQLVKGGTLLKSNPTSRSILLPVTVKDFNQVRTIKIISTGGSSNVGVNGRGVRTVVSTVRQPNASAATVSTSLSNPAAIRTALLTTVRGQDSKSLLKGGAATTVVTSARPSGASKVCSTLASPTRTKTEFNDDDEESRTSFQQLTLSDEEKRLLKKEGITLPTHYPLTKHEERELKRIRRKIRNKISAQDSRKRKKDYIDGLEDRVKACTEENQQLQKRIRSLEAQNESLLVQMRKFQNAVIGGSNNGRSQVHASTALMMLILSTALFVVPSLRQDTKVSDNELSLPSTKISNPGHRTLLEAGSGAIVPSTLEALETLDDEIASDLDSPLVQALTDHDYTPATKRQRTLSKNNGYYVPPLDDFPPQLTKTDSGGGFPPDHGSGSKIAARIMDAVVDHSVNNFSDPGGKHGNPHTVVVNLGKAQKRLRDDLELE